MLPDEVHQMIAQVAHRERFRRMGRQISHAQFSNRRRPSSAKTGIIVPQAIEQPKPVLPVIDRDAIDAGEAVVGLDEFRRNLPHSPAVAEVHLRAAGGSQRVADAGESQTLKIAEFGFGLPVRIFFCPLPVLRERVGVRVLISLDAKKPSPQPSLGVPGEGVNAATFQDVRLFCSLPSTAGAGGIPTCRMRRARRFQRLGNKPIRL